MDTEAAAAPFFAQYGLADVPRFSDPERRLYAAFGLGHGGITDVFGPKVWIRGPLALLGGHGVGWSNSDKLQMPGTFLVHDGRIVREYRHASIADRPDYLALGRRIG